MRPLLPLLALLCTAAFASHAAPVQVGVLPAKIVPEQMTQLSMEKGILTQLADNSGRLEKGSIIAVLNEEELAREREEAELKLCRDRLNNRDEIRKLELQRSKVEFYLSLSKEERQYASDLKDQNTPASRESLRDINERIDLLKRELNSMERLKRTELQQKQEKNTLKMPFSGKLQYHFPLPENLSAPYEYNQTNHLPFATVCDDSAYYITVNISRAELTVLPENLFETEVKLADGKILKGTYSHRRVEQNRSGGGDMLVYFFRLPQEEHETAFRIIGSHVKARLLFHAGEGTEMLTKSELATHPETEHCRNWEELVEKLYPDYNIILIGDSDIIIRRK